MIKDNFVLIAANILFIGLLPKIFFRNDGRYNLRWFLTAAPFFLAFLLLVAFQQGYLRAMSVGPALDVLSVLLSAASIALIALTVGSHRHPLALWHQTNDRPVEIVTWGPYSRVRHPFYSAFLLTLLATLAAAPHPATLLTLLYGVVVMGVTARREERRLLESHLAQTYRDYMTTSGRFVPGIGRLRT
jgi:protein-S-isoprenylcysteine O-methyltransferase Ste14